MPRFVILRHETPANLSRGLHWDFMLEHEGALRTWALSEEPQCPGIVAALELAVHRMAYLQYEGPVSGDRGSVTRWDEGEFQLLAESSDRIELTLLGRRLSGRVLLLQDPGDPIQWTFRLESG